MARTPIEPDTENDGGDPATSREGRPKAGFLARLRAYFLAGVLITAPIAITFYLAWVIVGFFDAQVTPLIPRRYNPETYLPFAMPGLGLLVTLVILTLIGWLTAGFMGRFFHRVVERVVDRLPVIRNVYGTIKQIFETVLAQRSNAFREAVLVEYPRRGIWAIGFITGRTTGEVQNVTEEETVNVFLPTTPNPTSGFLLFVPKEDLMPLSMSVEEAIKMVISGGIVTPPDRRSKAKRKKIGTVSAKTYEDLDILRERENMPILIPRENKDQEGDG